MNWKHFFSVFMRVLEVISDILYYVYHEFFGGSSGGDIDE